MGRLTRLLTCAALAAIASCGGGPDVEPPPKPVRPTGEDRTLPPAVEYGSLDLLAGLEMKTLDNGMKAFVKEDRRLPIVSTVLVYRVGSVHEPEGTSGLAHFLEHMSFKGTDKYAKGEIDRITVRAGGTNNAYTENDFTLYYFTVAADALDEILKIEASRMRNSVLDPKEMDGERSVVLEELNRLLDSPSGKLKYEIDQVVFKRHSYRRPGWGFEEDLKTVKHEVMKEFYDKHYGPNNAALIVVGDVDRERVFARIGELFGGIARVSPAEPPTPPEPPQAREERREIDTDKSLDRIGFAWRTNKTGSEEDFILDVIQNLLTHGKDSRLFKRLIVKDRSALSVDATNNARRYDGVFYIFAEVNEKKDPKELEKAVLEELEDLKSKPVGSREVQKAKNLITASFIFGKETTLDLADSIGVFEGEQVPNYLREYVGKINAVTPEKIQQVARLVFRPENRTVVLAKGKPQRQPRRAAQAQPAVAEFGEYHEHRLPSGLTVLIKPRRGLPIVSIVAYVNAGPLTERAEKAGVAVLTGQLLDQGVDTPDGHTRSAEEIAEAIEFTGAQLSTSSNGIGVKCLTRDSGMMLDFLRDMLLYPSFPDDRVELFRSQQLEEIQAVGDSPSDLAQELWYKNVFAGHPLERPAHGLAERVEKLTRADVAAHHKAFYRPDNTIIAIAGDVDPSTALRDVRRRFAEWPSPGPAVIPPLPDLVRQDKPSSVIEYRKAKQINFCFGHLSLPHTHPDYFAMRVFEQVFCSSPAFTDRLTRIVREDLHLAYDLGGVVTTLAPYPAPFLVTIGSSSQNGMQARDATLKILQELLTEGPKEEELETAKGYLTRSIPFRWESAEGVANYMVTCRRLRLGIDWPLRYRAGIAAVTKEEVLRAARAHIFPDAFTTVIVGPVDKDGKVKEDDNK